MADNQHLPPPNDNADWFQRRIFEELSAVRKDQRELINTHQQSLKNLQATIDEHTKEDHLQFEALKTSVTRMLPSSIIVYAAVAVILSTVFGAMVFLATGHVYHGQ